MSRVLPYPAELSKLLELRPTIGLTLGPPHEAFRHTIEAIALPPACEAGLWLLFDFEAESHAISQDLHTPAGSLWHGILHRREPDAWNSKYWFRQAGEHTLLAQLRQHCVPLGYRYTTPAAFIDDCETHHCRGTPTETLLIQVQLLEWDLLFAWCWEKNA
ncbi:MAG: hypothetical protein ACRCZF_18785 [Gemmataceae bacterium]